MKTEPTTIDKAPKKKTRVVFTDAQRWHVETAVTDYWHFRVPYFAFHPDEVAVRALREKVKAVTFEVDAIEREHLLQAIDNAIFNSQSQVYGNTLRRARAAVEKQGGI
jgi:hypothetical protein